MALAANFFGSTIESKSNRWKEVKNWIESHYKKSDLNIDAYSAMFGNGEKTNDQIFEALEQNWKEAAERRKARRQENELRNINISIDKNDYEERKKIRDIVFKYPQLIEILKCIGRGQENNNEHQDKTITIDLPILLRHSNIKQEPISVTTGNNLSNLLPSEYAIMDEDIFYKKYVDNELQQFSSKIPLIDKKKTKEQIVSEPRMDNGPVILAIDTSSSMWGRPLEICKSLLMQIVDIARKQKRKCFLITFSVRAKVLEITRPSEYGKVNEFFEDRRTGYTDGEEMFSAAISALNKDNYNMADVLVISDFKFPVPTQNTANKIFKEQSLGTKFYGLCIGGRLREYKKYLDKDWSIK